MVSDVFAIGEVKIFGLSMLPVNKMTVCKGTHSCKNLEDLIHQFHWEDVEGGEEGVVVDDPHA